MGQWFDVSRLIFYTVYTHLIQALTELIKKTSKMIPGATLSFCPSAPVLLMIPTWNMSVLLSCVYSTTTVCERDRVYEMLCCSLLLTAFRNTEHMHCYSQFKLWKVASRSIFVLQVKQLLDDKSNVLYLQLFKELEMDW